MGSNKVRSVGLDNHTVHFDRAQMDRVCSRWSTLIERAGHRSVRVCSKRPTLTEPTRDRVIRACSRAPRSSTRYMAQTRWKKHTEPTWHRLDRVCSREQDLDFVASLYTSMLDSPYRGEKSLSLLTPWIDQPYGGRVESR